MYIKFDKQLTYTLDFDKESKYKIKFDKEYTFSTTDFLYLSTELNDHLMTQSNIVLITE